MGPSPSDSDQAPLIPDRIAQQNAESDHVTIAMPITLVPSRAPTSSPPAREPRYSVVLDFHTLEGNTAGSRPQSPLSSNSRSESCVEASTSLVSNQPKPAGSLSRLAQWLTGSSSSTEPSAQAATLLSSATAPGPSRAPGSPSCSQLSASVPAHETSTSTSPRRSRTASQPPAHRQTSSLTNFFFDLEPYVRAAASRTELEPVASGTGDVCVSNSSPIRAESCTSSTSEALCLICLEPLKLDSPGVTSLGCSCTGPASYRHKECVLNWIRHKGDRTCEICKTEMVDVILPPPPPYAIFDDLPEAPGPQFMAFIKLISNHGAHWFIYCLCVCLVFKVPVGAAIALAFTVVILHTIRCTVMVCTNYIAHRRVFHLRLDLETGEA